MSEKQNAVQAGAPKAMGVCLLISAAIVLASAWYLDWAPYYKTYAVMFAVLFLGNFAGWAGATDRHEARQAIKEMNERDRERG